MCVNSLGAQYHFLHLLIQSIDSACKGRATVAAMTTITGKPANAVTQTESNILAALEEHGSRMTWPRRELAALLARRTDSFSAEEIVTEASEPGARHHLPHAASPR